MSIQKKTCVINPHSPNEIPKIMIKIPNFLLHPIAEYLLNDSKTPVDS